MLNGWKAIGAYLRRDERTAMRWAAERGLPVHRTPGRGRGSVYALPQEIDDWFARDRAPAPPTALPATGAPPTVPALPARAPMPTIDLKLLPWWRQNRAIAAMLIGGGALLAGLGALALGSRAAAPAPIVAAASPDPTTRALLDQALYDWNLRTDESLQRAAREYGEVIEREPELPAAYVGLANTFLLRREHGAMPDGVAYPRAQAAAQAALALAPGSWEAHRALAFIDFWWKQDRTAARREFARALALNPHDPLTHHWHATALLANGEAQAALREIETARELDPTATETLSDQALIRYVAGERAAGLDTLRTLAREQPSAVGPHRALAEIAMAEGRTDEFLRESAITAQLRDDAAGLAQVRRWAALGSAKAVRAAMRRDAAAGRDGWFHTAQVAAVLGDKAEAEAALARACARRERATISVASDIWLSRALSQADMARLCGSPEPLA